MELWTLNLRHLRAILEITRLGSIRAAADAVALTQPAVTQAVARTEQQLGALLFERRADGMAPTAAADLLAPRIAAALDHIGSPRVTMAQLRAFIAVAGAGSYAGASAATGLSQPSLHRAIKDLSVSLRGGLVERRGRGITVTQAGRRLVRAFRLARAELNAGLVEIERLHGRETSRIAIGAMPLARARLLPAAVNAFRAAHPDVKIAIVEGSYAELIEPLRDGELDMLIGALRPDGEVEGIVQTALFEDRPVVIAGAGHPLCVRGASYPDVRALAQYPWIIAAPGTPLRTRWARMFAEAGVAAPDVPIECGSVITIRELLTGSNLLTMLSPDQLRVELEMGLLREICPAPASVIRVIGLFARQDWRPTQAQSAFVEAFAVTPGLSKTYIE